MIYQGPTGCKEDEMSAMVGVFTATAMFLAIGDAQAQPPNAGAFFFVVEQD
jgi:hypothetical protein